MTKKAIDYRQQSYYRAVRSIKRILEKPPASYRAFRIYDSVFDIIALKSEETMVLKIVLDEITSEHCRMVRESEIPKKIVKKILCKKKNKRDFEEKTIN